MTAEKIRTEKQREAAQSFLEGIRGREVPAPGIYRDVPMERYLDWAALSSGIAREMIDRSPSHAKYRYDHPEPAKPYTDLGTAIHACALEPDLFAARYRIVAGPWNANPGKRDKVAAEEDGYVAIKPEDYSACIVARTNLQAHTRIGKLFADPDAMREVSVVFEWPTEHGPVICKLRADLLSQRYGMCADLKSTTNANRRPFLSVCRQMGYHYKAAFYVEGLAQAGLDVQHYLIPAVEQAEPCGVRAYAFSMATMNQAGLAVEGAVTQWAACKAVGRWPGYDDGIEELGVEGDYL